MLWADSLAVDTTVLPQDRIPTVTRRDGDLVQPACPVRSAEFTNDFINMIGNGKRDGFRRPYRDVEVLLVDDIQFLKKKEGTLEELAPVDKGHQCVWCLACGCTTICTHSGTAGRLGDQDFLTRRSPGPERRRWRCARGRDT